ncbi:MAG: flagellar basal-body rod protein FlgF [Xanthobacteraceae bacterium]|nr:flagellar basal-body rod protein FlgF [Xanthobacteraceae bacterium]
MENTLLIGLSRQVALERQIDVVANNVANVNTNGFKADQSLFQEFLMPTAHQDNFIGRDRRLSYVQDRATFHDFAQGPTQETKNPLDVAIDGNAFFVVQTPGGERYSRDGGFRVNATGQLVNSSGFAVMGANGPIQMQQTDHDITISADGTITVTEGANTRVDSVRGKLRLVKFANPQRLVKEGANLFSAGGAAPQADTAARVQQGFIEKSNVNAVVEMSRMIAVSRAYTQISALLQQQSDLRRTAIEKLADVPA